MDFMRRINSLIFPLLLLISVVLLAWLSTQKISLVDLSSNQRQSLSEASRLLLNKIPDPIQVDIFINRDDQLGQKLDQLLQRYQRIKPDFTVNFIPPEDHPDQVRQHNIRRPGEMLIHYHDQLKHLKTPSEQGISNAIASLLRGQHNWLVFLQGHGERDPQGSANFDFSELNQQLKVRGFNSQTLNLQTSHAIPENTVALIIADNKTDFEESEWLLIEKYLDQGGNLLWLREPQKTTTTQPVTTTRLANKLGIKFLAGTVVDGVGQRFNITQPDLVPVVNYPKHPISEDFKLTSLFPQACALRVSTSDRWVTENLLVSSEQSWTELSPIQDHIAFDQDAETAGPLTLATTLEARQGNQRMVIIGDSDFLSNSYISNGGNLDLGLRIFNWLSDDDQLITIPARPATDLDFQLSKKQSMLIGLVFLLLLPLLFGLIGLIIWWQRRT